MAVSLMDALEKVLTPYNDWRLKLIKEWSTCVGSLQTQVRLERIDNDVVIIGVYDVHWMQELYLLSRTIIEQINKQLGAPHVHQVRFQLVERRSHRRRFATPRVPPLVKNENRILTQRQQEALNKIQDPHLKEALHNFLMKSRDTYE